MGRQSFKNLGCLNVVSLCVGSVSLKESFVFYRERIAEHRKAEYRCRLWCCIFPFDPEGVEMKIIRR